jgi:hypothetical protein
MNRVISEVFPTACCQDAIRGLGYMREWSAHTTLFAEKHKPENISILRATIQGGNILEFLQRVRIRPNTRLSHGKRPG